MQKTLVVDCSFDYKRNAILENSELTELIIEENHIPQVASIYLGKVKKILKDKFIFIDLGYEKNAFLCLTDKKEQLLYSTNNNKKTLSIKEGQDILVQVKKDGSDLKGALVTSSLSISGKYVVLLLNEESIGISNKITNTNLRNNLKEFVQKTLPKGYGIIIRTNACEADEACIQKEINELIKISKEILQKSKQLDAPTKIYSAQSETEKIIQDYLADEDNVYINDKNEYEKLKKKTNFKNLNFYNLNIPIFEHFYIESQLEKAFHNKIWLKNGGFIIIDEVEAMNIIDVNSGKNITKNYDEMIFKTNLQAVYEIFKQIRLRNLTGMILIDFINMKSKEHKQIVYDTFCKLIKTDRTNTHIVSMTELQLLQLTRKKTRKSLQEMLMCSCPVCLGSGIVKNEKYVANIIKNKVLHIFSSTKFDYLKISSNRKIINSFENIFDIKDFEQKHNKKIDLSIIQTAKFDYFEIEKGNIK